MHKRIRGRCSKCGWGDYDIENCGQCRADLASYKRAQSSVALSARNEEQSFPLSRSRALTGAERQRLFRARKTLQELEAGATSEYSLEEYAEMPLADSGYTWRAWWWCVATTLLLYGLGFLIKMCGEVFGR